MQHYGLTTTAPNRLGQILSYFAAAHRFAFDRKADPRRLSYSFLSSMAETARYKDYNDTVDTAEAIKLAITSAWVYSGIKLIADRVSSHEARFQVKQRVSEELRDIRGHPFEVLLERPNSLMTTDFILRYTTFWAFLSGNAYIFVATPFPGLGKPEELWPLPANRIRPLPTTLRTSKLTGKPCIDYEYKIDDLAEKPQILPGENVIHIRFANIFDYWQGLSPLTALMDAVKLDRYQIRYLQGFFGKDNAIPTAIVSVPQETNDIDFEVIKEQIRQQFGEGRRSAITRAGDLNVQTITQTLHEMEVVNARKFGREEINHVLGIPDGLVSGGLSGDSRLSTEITFVRNTVQPFLDMVAGEFSAAIGMYYGTDIVITAPSVIPADRALKIQEYTQYSQDRSINENRRELNLPPLDLVGVMENINGIREKAGLDAINTPLDDATLDLMLAMPTRLLPMISSNTFSSAAKTGLRPGQKNAAGEDVVDPMQQWLEMQQAPVEEEVSEDESGTPPSMANTEVPPGTPDMTGQQGPLNEQQKLVGRAYLSPHARAAMQIGQKEELLRWKKVALKLARTGNDPGSYEFSTRVLPETMLTTIRGQLVDKDETSCGIIFDAIIATLQDVQL